MAFVVETGTGAADANSFASVADFKSYSDDRGYDYSSYTDGQIEIELVKATDYVDGYKFIGAKYTSAQSLQWPRSCASAHGFYIGVDEIPRQVVNATIRAAQLILSGNTLVTNEGKFVVQESVSGAVSVTYSDKKLKSGTTWTEINRILAPVLTAQGVFVRIECG